MKNKFTALLAFCMMLTSLFLNAQELPQPSPLGKVEQKVGLTNVSIAYSRPSVKGRAIFGDLVPFGEIWRTGANKATEITFSTDVKIGGKEVKAGKYSLFTIPTAQEWTIILNKNTELWGSDEYKIEDDAARIMVKPLPNAPTESMTITIDNVDTKKADISISWEKVKVSFPIEVEFDVVAMENIKTKIEEAEETFSVYNGAARYYLENNKDVKQALEWAQKSVNMKAEFWNLLTLAKAQAANGQYKQAIETANKSKLKSVEAKNTAYEKRATDGIAEWTKLMTKK
jgi:Protein of unknown function (DUF2911)